MGQLLNTNVEAYKAIALEAHRKMQEYISSGRKPKSDGSSGWIVSFDPERNSLKQALVTVVFSAIWLTAFLHLRIARNLGVRAAKKFDNDFSYKNGLELLGCSDETVLNAVERLRVTRKDLVHEKAHLDNMVIQLAENEADNAFWIIKAIEKHFTDATTPTPAVGPEKV